MNKDQIVKLAVEAALEYIEKQQEKQVKSRHDRRLRNTKLLLRNYNLLRTHCENSIYTMQQATERPIDILDDIDRLDKETYIDSIKRSVTRTYVILSHIDEMLRFYRIYCESSDKPEDIRRYRVLYAAYFEGMKIPDICDREGIDESTYYRDSRDSIEKLSALIFGIDGLSVVRKT